MNDEKLPTALGIETESHTLENESAWRFDPDFFEETKEIVLDEQHDYNPLHEGGVASFRLVNGDGREKFLHLFNCHNGYYAHGFTMKAGDKELHQGSL